MRGGDELYTLDAAQHMRISLLNDDEVLKENRECRSKNHQPDSRMLIKNKKMWITLNQFITNSFHFWYTRYPDKLSASKSGFLLHPIPLINRKTPAICFYEKKGLLLQD